MISVILYDARLTKCMTYILQDLGIYIIIYLHYYLGITHSLFITSAKTHQHQLSVLGIRNLHKHKQLPCFEFEVC